MQEVQIKITITIVFCVQLCLKNSFINFENTRVNFFFTELWKSAWFSLRGISFNQKLTSSFVRNYYNTMTEEKKLHNQITSWLTRLSLSNYVDDSLSLMTSVKITSLIFLHWRIPSLRSQYTHLQVKYTIERSIHQGGNFHFELILYSIHNSPKCMNNMTCSGMMVDGCWARYSSHDAKSVSLDYVPNIPPLMNQLLMVTIHSFASEIHNSHQLVNIHFELVTH